MGIGTRHRQHGRPIKLKIVIVIVFNNSEPIVFSKLHELQTPFGTKRTRGWIMSMGTNVNTTNGMFYKLLPNIFDIYAVGVYRNSFNNGPRLLENHIGSIIA